MTLFGKYLKENKVDRENQMAVAQAAKAYMRKESNTFTEEEKLWVLRCINNAKVKMEEYRKKKKRRQIDKLLPSL